MGDVSVIVNLPKKLDEFLARSERILGCAIGDKNGLTMALKGDINQDDVAVGVNALQEINKNVQESKTLYLYDYKESNCLHCSYIDESLFLVQMVAAN